MSSYGDIYINRVADKCTATPQYVPSVAPAERDFSISKPASASLFSLETLAVYLEIKMVKSASLCLSDILRGFHAALSFPNLTTKFFKVPCKRETSQSQLKS